MSEQGFKYLARKYAEQNGMKLRDELTCFDVDTTSLDRRVRGRLDALRRRRHRRAATLVAACLLLVLVTPMLLRQFIPAAEHTPDTFQPSLSDTDKIQYEIIPLSFVLPDGFTVSAVDQDAEKTIYYLNSTRYDSVVMTLEQSVDTSFFAELTPYDIVGKRVYVSEGGGYCLLTYELDGVLYILTSRSDMLPLYEIFGKML